MLLLLPWWLPDEELPELPGLRMLLLFPLFRPELELRKLRLHDGRPELRLLCLELLDEPCKKSLF